MIVFAPVEPARTVPLGPLTATGTFWRATFSRIKLPVLDVPLFHTVSTKTGQFWIVLSRIVTDPTLGAAVPPLIMESAV